MKPEVIIQTRCVPRLRCVCSTQTIVDGEIEIPHKKPEAEQVVDFRVACEVTHFQTIDTPLGTKVIVQGFVNIGMQYVANFPEQPVHFAHFKIPWHTFFLCNDPFCNIDCCVEFADFEQLDGRRFSKVVALFVCAKPEGTCPPAPPCPCPEDP